MQITFYVVLIIYRYCIREPLTYLRADNWWHVWCKRITFRTVSVLRRYLVGGSQVIDPPLDAIIVLPVCDIVEEGMWTIKMRRNFGYIHDYLFPVAYGFLVVNKLLSHLNRFDKVEFTWLQNQVNIVFIQNLMYFIDPNFLEFTITQSLSLHTSINIFKENFFQAENFARANFWNFLFNCFYCNLHFPSLVTSWDTAIGGNVNLGC